MNCPFNETSVSQLANKNNWFYLKDMIYGTNVLDVASDIIENFQFMDSNL